MAAALGGMSAAAWISFRLTPIALTELRQRARRWQSIYLLFALGAVLVYGLALRPEWIYAHIAITLSAGFTLGYELLYGNAYPLTRGGMFVIGAGVVGITAMRILALSVYPAYNINDEPWVMDWALSYARYGEFSHMIMYYGGGDIHRFMLPVAWWIRLVGEGFWQTRLFFFLMLFPLTLLTALAARNLYKSGWIAALVMFSSAVVMGGARIRQDVGLAVAVAAALWLYTEAVKRQKNVLHFLAGVAIGLGWFAHYHAIGFGAVLFIALYIPLWVERRRRGEPMPVLGASLFIVGGLVAAGCVFLLQIVPDWEGFLVARQFRNPHTLSDLAIAFLKHWSNIVLHSQLELILILVALAAALWRRRLVDVQMALLLILMHAALALQANEAYPQYVHALSAVYGILLAGLFAYGFTKRRIAYAGVTAALFMLPNLGFTLQVPVQHLLQREPLALPIPPVAAWIRENVAPTEKIVTEHWYYLWLTDYEFISPLTPDYTPLTQRLDSVEALWDQIAPDVVILDRNLSTCCVQQPIFNAEYLASRGYNVVAEIPGERYPVLVYEKGAGND